MSAVMEAPQVTVNPQYVDKVIAFNVKIRLASNDQSQTALGEALGIKRASMSQKMTGRSSWSASDLVNAANFLKTDAASLLDDTILQQLSSGRESGNLLGIADTRPRFFVSPSELCAPPGIRTLNPRLKRTLL